MKQLLILAAAVFSACVNAQNSIDVKTFKYEAKQKDCICSVDIQIPTTSNPKFNQTLLDSIANMIEDLKIVTYTENFNSPFKKTNGIDQTKLYIVNYAKAIAFYDQKEYNIMAEDSEFPGAGSERSLNFELVFETPTYVVFNEECYGYSSGAAHGNSFFRPRTFRKNDGKGITQFISPNKNSEFLSFLKRNLKRFKIGYSVDEGMPDDVDDYWDEIYDYTDNLESFEPGFMWIQKGMLNMQYNSYEIGPYAFGNPVISIPLSEVQQFLSDEVKLLLQ